MAAGGASTDNPTIAALQAGSHDPRRRGFIVQGAELAISGAVDPFFTA